MYSEKYVVSIQNVFSIMSDNDINRSNIYYEQYRYNVDVKNAMRNIIIKKLLNLSYEIYLQSLSISIIKRSNMHTNADTRSYIRIYIQIHTFSNIYTHKYMYV